MSDDPDAELLGWLMQEWLAALGAAAAGVRDLVARAEFAPGGEERGGGINRNRLGWWIKRHEGRFVDNRRIIPDRTAGGNAKSLAHRIGFFGFVGSFQPATQSVQFSRAHR